MRDVRARLFEFGAWLYRVHQPQFLGEYLTEFLDDKDPEFGHIARNAITAARQEIVQGSFSSLLGNHFDEVSETLRLFHDIEERLAKS